MADINERNINQEQEIDKTIYGYVINDIIFFDARRGCLWNIDAKNLGSNFIKRVVLRKTTNRLLIFLLFNCVSNLTPMNVNTLMFNVWDKYDLQSSNQRLWQAVKFLNFKIMELGGPRELFFRSGGDLFINNYANIKLLQVN
ncbi:hypothetical protein [Serratia sp. JKS296]|uniref:hypothetical protein n=1 Tax=Serratia sp. JKS296 TaxID=1938824 RepID=UPI000BE2E136|nr:hypothetical protein [Serratia sp. JKS296]